MTPFAKTFQKRVIDTNGTKLFVRVGGNGPAVVLLHGFGDTGDMWARVANVLVKNHTVIVPDLRGMGLSAHPDTGYTKKNEAQDIAGVMDALKIEKADLVTHDIGNMVGYALAAQFPARITKWAVIDAPLPRDRSDLGGAADRTPRRQALPTSTGRTRRGWLLGASVSILTGFYNEAVGASASGSTRRHGQPLRGCYYAQAARDP